MNPEPPVRSDDEPPHHTTEETIPPSDDAPSAPNPTEEARTATGSGDGALTRPTRYARPPGATRRPNLLLLLGIMVLAGGGIAAGLILAGDESESSSSRSAVPVPVVAHRVKLEARSRWQTRAISLPRQPSLQTERPVIIRVPPRRRLLELAVKGSSGSLPPLLRVTAVSGLATTRVLAPIKTRVNLPATTRHRVVLRLRASGGTGAVEFHVRYRTN